ncbi:MAG: YggT family protein [Xanthomonadales bacterium]|nr:YggT family protein [Xanthomonadales bacterium]
MNYLGNAGQLLIDTVFGLAMLTVLLRILMQGARADFYNPICQFIHRLTQPVIAPLRRFVPPLGRIDSAAVLVLLALSWLRYLVLKATVGGTVMPFINIGSAGPMALLVAAIAHILALLAMLWFWLLLISIVLSWIQPANRSPAIPLVFQLTEPLLAPFRRLLPQMGLDLSPLFAFIGIQLARLLLIQPLYDLAARMAMPMA